MPKNPWNKMISGCSNGQIISNGSDQDHLCGFSWPPRSYSCSFCKREFRSAQALGGHMNVHRRDRARLRQSSPIEFYHQESYPILSLNPNPNPNASPSPNLVPSSTVLELDLKSKRLASEPTSSFIRVLDQDIDICRFRSCLNENGTVSMKDVGVDLLPGGRGDHYVDLELRLGRP